MSTCNSPCFNRQHNFNKNNKKNKNRVKLRLLSTPPDLIKDHKLSNLERGIYEFIKNAIALNFYNKNKDAFFNGIYWVWHEGQYLKERTFGTDKKYSLKTIRRAYKRLKDLGLIIIAQNGKSIFGSGHAQMVWFGLPEDEYDILTGTMGVESMPETQCEINDKIDSTDTPKIIEERPNVHGFVHGYHYTKNIKNINTSYIIVDNLRSEDRKFKPGKEKLVNFSVEVEEIKAKWFEYFPKTHADDYKYSKYLDRNINLSLKKFSADKILKAIERHAKFMRLNPERYGHSLSRFCYRIFKHDLDVILYFEHGYKPLRLVSNNRESKNNLDAKDNIIIETEQDKKAISKEIEKINSEVNLNIKDLEKIYGKEFIRNQITEVSNKHKNITQDQVREMVRRKLFFEQMSISMSKSKKYDQIIPLNTHKFVNW